MGIESMGASEGVRGLTLIFERIGPGDRILLHSHSKEEILVIDEGRAEATLGEERRELGPESCVFVPASTPHGMRNAGTRSGCTRRERYRQSLPGRRS